MTRLLTGALLAGSAALGLWTVFTLARPSAVEEASPQAAAGRAVSATVARDDSQRRRDEVAMILARPPFSPTRRPREDAAAPAPAGAPVTALPRMSAILINGNRRSAIFDGGGKPTVISEGGHLGPFFIQSIEPQQVTIIGPEGKRVVRTTFSNEPPPGGPLQPGINPMLPGLMPPPPSPVILPPGMPTPGLPNLGSPR